MLQTINRREKQNVVFWVEKELKNCIMPVGEFNNYSAQNKEQTFKTVQRIGIGDGLISIADVEKHIVSCVL